MTRSCLIAMLLIFGLTIGLCLEPDSGTAAGLGAPDVAGASVGANHAKPLPEVPVVSDLVRLLPVLLLAVLALHLSVWAEFTPAKGHDEPRRPQRLTTAARRGPPVFAGAAA